MIAPAHSEKQRNKTQHVRDAQVSGRSYSTFQSLKSLKRAVEGFLKRVWSDRIKEYGF